MRSWPHIQDDITLDNYDEVLRGLSGAVRGATICESEQTRRNLAIVADVFARIAAFTNNAIIIEDEVCSLPSSYVTIVSTHLLFPPQTAQVLVHILGGLQQWNEDVLRANSPKWASSLEIESESPHSKKERAETTCIHVLIKCPGIQHRVHACYPVPVLF